MDGDVKGMLIHGEDLSVPVEDCPSCGIQCIGSNTAILGDTFIFIAFNDLKLKETNDDTDKKCNENNKCDFETIRIHGSSIPYW